MLQNLFDGSFESISNVPDLRMAAHACTSLHLEEGHKGESTVPLPSDREGSASISAASR